MEIRLNYIAKDGCVNDITIKSARGAKVTESDLHEAAQAIRGGKFRLFEEDDGSIWQNGTLPGYLYVIDEPVVPGRDVAPHPRSTMDANVEFLTKRPLRVRCIAEVPL